MPKFTTRHHNAIADVFWIRGQELLYADVPPYQQQARLNEWRTMQARFRNLFAGDNASFKPTKFDIACGLGPRVVNTDPDPDA